MKFFTLIIISLFLLTQAFGQTFVDFGIFETSPDHYVIRAQAEGTGLAAPPFNITSNFQITVRWLTSSPVTITGEVSPAGVTISRTSVTSSLAGATSGYSYVSFNYGPANAQIPIMDGQAIDLVTFTNSEGGSVVMQLMDNGNAPTDISLNLGQTYTALANPNDNYRLNYQPSTSPALPVELTTFEALPFEDTDVRLDWTTSVEVNSSHFEVERSQNGNDWTFAGKVEAAGFSTSRRQYQLLDEGVYQPGTGKKVFYYRLKQVDLDGIFDYSEIRSVTFKMDRSDIAFSIYPNPASEFLYIRSQNEGIEQNGDLRYRVFNSTGILIKEDLITDISTEVHLDSLTSGIYFIDIVNGFGQQLSREKIVVARD